MFLKCPKKPKTLYQSHFEIVQIPHQDCHFGTLGRLGDEVEPLEVRRRLVYAFRARSLVLMLLLLLELWLLRY